MVKRTTITRTTRMTSTRAPTSCSTACQITIGAVFGGVVGVILLVGFFCVCYNRCRSSRASDEQVVHVTTGNPNSPPQPNTAPVEPSPHNPLNWSQPHPPPPPPPQQQPPQPMYGAPLPPPDAPAYGVMPLGYTPPSYTPTTGGFNGYSGTTNGAADGTYYYSRGADPKEAETQVKPFSE